jgi:hypothetical protein
MYRELTIHWRSYTVLAGLLALGIFMFVLSWPNHSLQRLVAVGFGVGYALWGVRTHVKTKFITPRVVLEYCAMGGLASICLVLVTL